MLKRLPVKRLKIVDKDGTDAQMCPDAVLGVEMPQPQAKRKDTDEPICTRANECSSELEHLRPRKIGPICEA